MLDNNSTIYLFLVLFLSTHPGTCFHGPDTGGECITPPAPGNCGDDFGAGSAIVRTTPA